MYDYVWEEEDTEYSAFDETIAAVKKSQAKKEKTSHIAIHTLHVDGLRELFRHFLVLPDGAIVEVLGEMSYVPGLTKEVKKAINSGTKKVEHLMEFGSSMSLTKVRGRFHSGDAISLRTPVTGRAVHVSVENLKPPAPHSQPGGSGLGRPGSAGMTSEDEKKEV